MNRRQASSAFTSSPDGSPYHCGMDEERKYPPEAYAPDGKLWWELTKDDGVQGAWGTVPRMASWLYWNVEIDERFSTRELRDVLHVSDEHAQRRQRELREFGWEYLSGKEEPSLGDQCELKKYGWWPGEGPRPRRGAISAKLRREVFERDGGRCVICGRSAEDVYEDGSRVVLTAGHVQANSLGGAASLDNLQTECRRCNESAKADTGTPANPQAVLESVKSLKKSERLQMRQWLLTRRRDRTKLEQVYDTVRLGGPAVRDVVMAYLDEVASR